MDADRAELVQHLFVAMTEHAEALHESAMDGQAPHVSPAICTDSARRIMHLAEAVGTLSKAALILCGADDSDDGGCAD
jgi:hypothetical protein